MKECIYKNRIEINKILFLSLRSEMQAARLSCRTHRLFTFYEIPW